MSLAAEPRPGEVWVARLPGVVGELVVVVVDGVGREGVGVNGASGLLYGCAVLDVTMSLPYRVTSLHAYPLTSNDCWRRLA